MSVLGIGVDLVECARIEHSLERLAIGTADLGAKLFVQRVDCRIPARLPLAA